jgi:putative two-component system protein, hydrogenase maturation factor HypX/HoxX
MTLPPGANMRILLLSSAFSGLTQRFYTELDDAGYNVSVELHLGDEGKLVEGVELCKPDLIICPFLTKKIPGVIFRQYKCLIVHPGIKGDRGPSSLDWAIQEESDEWGVTLLEADDEMDAGPIWASKTFPMRPATKSSLFNREVTQAAVDCLWEALTYFDAPDFKPEPLVYSKPGIQGRLRPMMKQADRTINWKKHKTADILKRIRAADGSPGVLDEIYGKEFYLYNAHPEPQLRGKPGDLIAIANQAICRATADGAVWIGHLKEKRDDKTGIKLPATMALRDLLPKAQKGLQGLFAKPLKTIEIDYFSPGKKHPCQEVWYEIQGEAAYLHFPFHNGGMSTEQCRLLLAVYKHVATLNIKAIVLVSGDEYWSNGIHLNHIEAAENPADESWQNINAIDDIVYQIITTLDKLTIAAIAGNAGAGGAILAIAPDKVFVRQGVVFNPHYKNMGELYGSEYWTYLLPKRVGFALASELTEQRLPVSAKKAWHLGMADRVLDAQHGIFMAQVKHLVNSLISDKTGLENLLSEKSLARCRDEAIKPLAAYRKFELTQMYANFYGNEAYHEARKGFVFKKPADGTQDNLAKHRQQNFLTKALPGSMIHYVWQDSYQLGDDKVDAQHKDFFEIAQKLMTASKKDDMLEIMFNLYAHVKEHFGEEESLMKKAEYHLYKSHSSEHNIMLEKLMEMDKKIQADQWKRSDIEHFIDKWTKHIVNADMVFNEYWKDRNKFLV